MDSASHVAQNVSRWCLKILSVEESSISMSQKDLSAAKLELGKECYAGPAEWILGGMEEAVHQMLK